MHVASHRSKTVELGARLAGLSHLVCREYVWALRAPDRCHLPAAAILWERRGRL